MKSVFRKVAIAAIAVITMSMAANAQKKGDMLRVAISYWVRATALPITVSAPSSSTA
jgi:hypothetical protein